MSVAPVLIKEVGSGARQTSKEFGKLSIQLFQFDFVNLSIQLIAWFGIAILIDKIHYAVNSVGVNVASTIASVFGYKLPTAANEPKFFKKLFGEGYFGLKYWDLVAVGAIILTFVAFMTYYENEKRNGGTPSAFTIGIFVLIMLLLSAFTLPQIIAKLRARKPNVVLP